MMRIMKIVLAVIFILTTSFVSAPDRNVYICTGPKSVAYHLSTRCRGLDRCSASIKMVSQQYAIDKGRRGCKLCTR